MGSISANPGFVADDPESAGVAEVAQREPPDGNNSTIVHRNPEAISEDESLDQMRTWLSREMSGRLVESINVSREDRERARELIGNDSEYGRLAGQYESVRNRQDAGDLNDSDGPISVGIRQREFLAEVEAYRETLEEYRQARTNDETLRERRLAHELERHFSSVNRTATRLNESYANVSTMEESKLRNATRTIGEIRSNVTRTQMTVRDQTLVRTELSVRTDDSTGSFTDPIPLVGQLRNADGDPIADENVTLKVGNRTLDATTEGSGRFEVEYRPTLTEAGERPRSVEFTPANESVYLGDNETVELDVRRATPNVTVRVEPKTIRYNETLIVNGTVSAGGVGVPDVPLSVTVDGDEIAQVRTDEVGEFGVEKRLPANVSAGQRRVNASLALENATSGADGRIALAPANGSTQVSVQEMPTSLSISEVQTFNETAFVAGRLTIENATPLANRTVELQIDGRTVGTVVTNGTGDYATTVTIPQRLLGGGSTVEIVAVHSSPDGNLAAARTTATATVDSPRRAISPDHLRLGLAGLIGVAVIGAFVWRFQSDETDSKERDVGGTDERASHSVATVGSPTEVLLDSATADLDVGQFDAAVVAAYGATRHLFEDATSAAEAGRGSPRTHWEFYVACRDVGLSEERRRRLERLTEIYERAAFADESVSEADAREAVADARALREAAESDAGALGGEFPDGERFEREQSESDSGDVGGSPAA